MHSADERLPPSILVNPSLRVHVMFRVSQPTDIYSSFLYPGPRGHHNEVHSIPKYRSLVIREPPVSEIGKWYIAHLYHMIAIGSGGDPMVLSSLVIPPPPPDRARHMSCLCPATVIMP